MDTVHLVKSVRNNFFNRGHINFPGFHFKGFWDHISFPAGAAAWSALVKVNEFDKDLQASLRMAPELTSRAICPLACKQNVSVALAPFRDSTRAAVRIVGGEHAVSTDAFLGIINTFWLICNSKSTTSNHPLGRAACAGDKKPEFLRAFAKWAEGSTLTKQTVHAISRTARRLASAIEDLLDDGYKFVLVSRFQSDPLEGRFGCYRQMSGGRFLVSVLAAKQSEKIKKIQALLKISENPGDVMVQADPAEFERLRAKILHIVSC
jgi:hypothetical protein